MRAARYHGVHDIRLEELPDPTPQAGQVLVKVAHNGICGSDLHEYYSASTFIPTAAAPAHRDQRAGGAGPRVLRHGRRGRGRRRCRSGRPERRRAPDVQLRRMRVLPARPAAHLSQARLPRPVRPGRRPVRADHPARRDGPPAAGLGPARAGRTRRTHGRRPPRHPPGRARAGRPRRHRRGRPHRHRAVVRAQGQRTPARPGQRDLSRAARRHHRTRRRPRHRPTQHQPGRHRRRPQRRNRSRRRSSTPPESGQPSPTACRSSPRADPVVVVGIHEKPFDFNPTSLLLQEVDVIGSIVYSPQDYDEVIANMVDGRYDTKGWVDHVPLDDTARRLRRPARGAQDEDPRRPLIPGLSAQAGRRSPAQRPARSRTCCATRRCRPAARSRCTR